MRFIISASPIAFRPLDVHRARLCPIVVGVLFGIGLIVGTATKTSAQIAERFDGGLPRWQLGFNDTQALIAQQQIDLRGGRHGTPAEQILLMCGSGTMAETVYPLPTAAVIEEFKVELWVRAPRTCGPLGIRVRFPMVADPRTGSPLATVVLGSSYQQAGEWQKLTVGDVKRQVRLREIALRSQYGSDINLADPYIDAIVFNTFQQPGPNRIWFEDLEIFGHVPVNVSQRPPPIPVRESQRDPFGAGELLRILEYRGEPMDWLKQIGIDALLLDRPPTEPQLTAAAKSGMLLITPPVPYAINGWDDRLGSIIGWHVGSAVDLAELPLAEKNAQAARQLPETWRRPIVMTVLEGWRQAATVGDVFIRELPCVTRGVSVSAAIETVSNAQAAVGRPHPWLVSIELSPPEGLVQQLDAAAAIGAPAPSSYAWHALWLRSIAALKTSPRGIVFRTHRPLDAGDNASQQQATLLRMVCRLLEGYEPMAAGAVLGEEPKSNFNDYRMFSLVQPDATLVIAVAEDRQSLVPRAGEGRVLEIALTPAQQNATAIRLVPARVQRLVATQDEGPRRLSIVSPDLVEAILLTNHPDVATRFVQRWQSLTQAATSDRLMLVSDELMSARNSWQSLQALAPATRPPWPLLTAAANSLADAQQAMQSNDWNQASSLVRRGDAFQLRSRNLLMEQLMPNDGAILSIPTLMAPGGVHLHLASPPFLGRGTWTRFPLVSPPANAQAASTSLNRIQSPQSPASSDSSGPASGLMADTGAVQVTWNHDRRLEEQAEVAVEFAASSKGLGPPAIRVSAWPRPGHALRGGYEGTTLRVRSPEITGLSGRWIRIEAAVRTPLGFGGPEQGLLFYDSIAGAELGALVPGGGPQTVRLYRLVPENRDFRLVFELLGAGEAWIDEVAIHYWEPRSETPLPFRPLEALPEIGSEVGTTISPMLGSNAVN